jgi:hypothetical protein
VEVGCGASDKAHIAALTRANRSMPEHCPVVINKRPGFVWGCQKLHGRSILQQMQQMKSKIDMPIRASKPTVGKSKSFFSAIIGPRSRVPRSEGPDRNLDLIVTSFDAKISPRICGSPSGGVPGACGSTSFFETRGHFNRKPHFCANSFDRRSCSCECQYIS